MHHSVIRPSIGAAAVVSLASGVAFAGPIPVVWDLAQNGAWSDPLNWNPQVVPNNGGGDEYFATIDAVGVLYLVDLDIDVELTRFTLNSVDAVVAAIPSRSLTVLGEADLGDGALRGVQFFSRDTLRFNGLNLMDICDTGIEHSGGAIAWTGAGDILLAQGSRFVNGESSTFSIESDADLFWDLTGAQSELENNGTITKAASAGVTTYTDISFINNGTVNVATGTIRATGANAVVSNAGTIDVEAGTTLEVVSGATLTNIAGNTLTGGTYTIRGTLGVDNADITTLDADLTLDGPASEFTNPAGAVDALANLDTIGGAGAFTVTNGKTFTTAGDLTISPTGRLAVGAGSTVTVAPGFGLTNFAAGTLTGGRIELTDGSLRVDNIDVVNLNGQLALSGATADIVDPVANASGIRNLATIQTDGELTFSNGRDFTTVGDFTVEGAGMLILDPGVTFRIADGFLLTNIDGGTFNAGNFDIRSGARLIVPPNQSFNRLRGRVALSGALGGLVDPDGNDLFGGLNIIEDDGDLQLADGRDLVLGGDLDLSGRVGIGPAGDEGGAALTIPGDLNQTGGLVELDGGTLTVGGNYNLSGGQLSGSGTLNGNVVLSGSGILGPGFSPGTLIVPKGNITLGRDTSIEIDVQGLIPGEQHDVIELTTGVLGFDGNDDGVADPGEVASLLRILVPQGMTFREGDTFEIMRYAAITGGFREVIQSYMGEGRFFVVHIGDTSTTLTYVPAPGAAMMGLLGVGVLGLRRRGRGSRGA